MGVYINMDMPKNEPLLVKINPDGSVSTTAKNGYMNYEAFPVPPHGRLIDADAAIDDIRGEILEHQMNGMKGTSFYIEDLRAIWQRLEDEELFPTIIPAEEGE